MRPDGETTELTLNLVEGRPGLYRTTFDAERPGLAGQTHDA